MTYITSHEKNMLSDKKEFMENAGVQQNLTVDQVHDLTYVHVMTGYRVVRPNTPAATYLNGIPKPTVSDQSKHTSVIGSKRFANWLRHNYPKQAKELGLLP